MKAKTNKKIFLRDLLEFWVSQQDLNNDKVIEDIGMMGVSSIALLCKLVTEGSSKARRSLAGLVSIGNDTLRTFNSKPRRRAA